MFEKKFFLECIKQAKSTMKKFPLIESFLHNGDYSIKLRKQKRKILQFLGKATLSTSTRDERHERNWLNKIFFCLAKKVFNVKKEIFSNFWKFNFKD